MILTAKKLAFQPLTAKPLTARALGAGDDTWAADMLATYRTLNPEQATWFDAAGSAVETELLARLQPGGYLHTTFGPSGQNKLACDFVFVLLTVGDILTRTITKSGDALRWDIDGTVTTQDDLPAHTLGVGAGVLTCSSTDGWDGLTVFLINDNQFSDAPPLWVFPNLTQFWIHNNQFSGAAPLWDFPAVTIFYLHYSQFSGAAPLWDFPVATNFQINNNQFSSVSAPLSNLDKISDLRVKFNGLSQSAVDAALLAIYTARANYTDATPELEIHGTNAAPSGTYQYSATPSTGLEIVYALANDPDGELFNKWTITYTGQAAAEWATDMLASYRTLNPEQATWFDSTGAAVETELLARLQPGGYLHTTFGPDGQNKTACDFVFVLKTVGNIVTRTITKSGDALRWDIDGTVTTQDDLPAHTLGAGAGVLTCSSTDGWTGVTVFYLYSNQFSGAAPNWNLPAVTNFRIYINQFSGAVPLWDFPAVATFWIYGNQFSGAAPLWDFPAVTNFHIGDNAFSGTAPLWDFPAVIYFQIYNNQFSGTAPNWDFPAVTTFYIHTNQFSGAAPLWDFPAVTNFRIYINQFSGAAPLWDFPAVIYFQIYVNQFSSISAPLPNLHAISDLLAQGNGLSQSEVDAALAAIYNNWASYTDATPELNISGTNAAPSGTYADEDPPTTGLGYVYELANDPETTGNETWTITYTGGVAP